MILISKNSSPSKPRPVPPKPPLKSSLDSHTTTYDTTLLYVWGSNH